jgi:hypothetical protein
MSVGIVDKQTGDRIPTAGMPAIDNALSATSTNPVQNAIITAALANKQNAIDNSLQTTDKTIVGGINELKSGLTNLTNTFKADGSATDLSLWANDNGVVVLSTYIAALDKRVGFKRASDGTISSYESD